MFDATQISNKKDLPERNIFLEDIENIALCHKSKNICDVFVLLPAAFDYYNNQDPNNLIQRLIVFNSWFFVRS